MKRENTDDQHGEPSRREFLDGCGKYAATVPPAMTFLLSTTLTSGAIAKSGNNGFGNGCCDGVPGKSGFEDTTR